MKQVDSWNNASFLGKLGAQLPWRLAGGLSIVYLRQVNSVFEVQMKTAGEIEAAVCEGMSQFEQEYMGRGPKDIRAHLIGDLLVVRLQGALETADQPLVEALPP